MVEDKVRKMHNAESVTCMGLPSSDEVKKLDLYVQIMATMFHTTLDMSEDKSPAMGLILPLLNKLATHFSETAEDTGLEKAVNKAVIDNLLTTMSCFGCICVLATYSCYIHLYF